MNREVREIPDGFEPISGFSDYFINRQGDILSFKRAKPRYLKASLTKTGHYSIGLFNGQRVTTRYLHRLVAEAFLDAPRSPGTHIIFKDGNPANYHANNLEWNTHTPATPFVQYRGLTYDDANAIRKRFKAGEKVPDLAAEYNAQVDVICRIARGQLYKTRKLSIDDVIAIRRRAQLGDTTKSLSDSYNVSESHIRNIVSRHVWKWVK